MRRSRGPGEPAVEQAAMVPKSTAGAATLPLGTGDKAAQHTRKSKEPHLSKAAHKHIKARALADMEASFGRGGEGIEVLQKAAEVMPSIEGRSDIGVAINEFFEKAQNNDDEKSRRRRYNPRATNSKDFHPDQERGSPEPRQRSPLPRAGHELARSETLSYAQQFAGLLAQHTKTSISDAETIIKAMRVNAPALVEASKKLLNRKPKLSIKDFSEAELRDPKVIRDAHKTVNENRRTRIEDLSEEEASKLRRARLIVKYDTDRRAKAVAVPS